MGMGRGGVGWGGGRVGSKLSNFGLRWFVYTCYECMLFAAPQALNPNVGKHRESQP